MNIAPCTCTAQGTQHTAHGTSSLLLRSTQRMAHDTRYSTLHLHCTQHTAHGTSSLLLRSTQHMAHDTRYSSLHLHLHCTRHTAHGTSSLLLRSTQHMAHDTRYSNLHLHCTRHTAHGTSSLLLRSTQHMAHDTRYSTLHLHCTRHTAHGSSSCSCKAHRTRRTSQINAHSALNKPYTPFLHSIRHKAQMFVGVKGTLVGQRAQRASYICITHHTAIPPQRHATFDF